VTKGCLCSDKTIYQCMKMFKFKHLQSTVSFYGHCSFTYLCNMHLIQLHDGIHINATVVTCYKGATESAERAQPRYFVYPPRPSVRPIVPICPSICHTGGSTKNGWWRLCNFHRTVNPYVQFLRHKFHSEILTDSLPWAGASNNGGDENELFSIALCVDISKKVQD